MKELGLQPKQSANFQPSYFAAFSKKNPLMDVQKLMCISVKFIHTCSLKSQMVLEGFIKMINLLEKIPHFLSLEATTFSAFNRFF